MPVIDNNVMIGAGAAILGEVMIGDGAKIRGNAVALESVPSMSTAVGILASIINKAY